MKRDNARTFRVGLFVLFGIVLSGIVVFTIGENRKAWDRKVQYHASYDDVVGLRIGSVVRMGGIDIGSVAEVEHLAGKENDNKVYVTLAIVKAEVGRIRKGTVATIEAKGLLGDRMVVLAWDEERAKKMREEGKENPLDKVPADGWLATNPPADLFGDAAKIAKEAKATLGEIKELTKGLADERFKEDLHGTMSSLRIILDGVALREGVAHRMIFDPEEAKKVDHILGNLEVASANIARVTHDANEITTQIKSGNGLAHAALYDDKLAHSTTESMVELNKSLEAIRTGNGLAHAIVYGDDQTQKLMGNVNAVTEDLRDIVAGMKAGRGTVGALLVDPSVYEDIKLLVGNVERNQVLRSLVRYSIKQNDAKSPEPPPPAPAKP